MLAADAVQRDVAGHLQLKARSTPPRGERTTGACHAVLPATYIRGSTGAESHPPRHPGPAAAALDSPCRPTPPRTVGSSAALTLAAALAGQSPSPCCLGEQLHRPCQRPPPSAPTSGGRHWGCHQSPSLPPPGPVRLHVEASWHHQRHRTCGPGGPGCPWPLAALHQAGSVSGRTTGITSTPPMMPAVPSLPLWSGSPSVF